MYDHSLQRFQKREEAAMRECDRIVMPEALPRPIRPSSKRLPGSTRSSENRWNVGDEDGCRHDAGRSNPPISSLKYRTALVPYSERDENATEGGSTARRPLWPCVIESFCHST
jgi:hypothetical protein